ncbi:hypothetical protein ACVI1J_003020 [Bradyrhizobium diazoefficiens]
MSYHVTLSTLEGQKRYASAFQFNSSSCERQNLSSEIARLRQETERARHFKKTVQSRCTLRGLETALCYSLWPGGQRPSAYWRRNSFFHTLKTELVHHRNYKTRADAQRDIFAFIEGFYNRTRLHSAVGYIAPIEMELNVA